MTPQEIKLRNTINLKALLIASIIPAALIYLIGYAASIAAPVAFVIVGSIVRANMMRKEDLNPEVI